VLQAGAVQLDQGSGVAWTEMARGTLLHWVRLAPGDGPPTVADAQVIAPTEWNFHMHGVPGRLLSDPQATLAHRLQQVPLLTAVYDPCVPLVVLGADGAPVMQYPAMAQDGDGGEAASARKLAGKESSCTN
jgi:hypothetical protein